MSGLEEQLPEERIRLDSPAQDAHSVLEELARLLGGKDDAVREAIRDDLQAREQVSTTGVGGGIAFPHARVASLPGIRLAFLRTAAPVEFHALDGAGVDLFLGLAGPVQDRREYLSALGKVSYFLRSSSVRDDLRRAGSPGEVRRLVQRLSAQEGPVT